MVNILDPCRPQHNCFSDVKWSPSSSRFFSTEACQKLSEPQKLNSWEVFLELGTSNQANNAPDEDEDIDPKLYDYEALDKGKKSRITSGNYKLLNLVPILISETCFRKV